MACQVCAGQLLLVLLLACHLHCISAFYSYRLRIPNGERVPNPCQEGSYWEGVGHQNPAGAGLRNPFGRDFAANGYRWTEQLCRKDSDGDGVSNGAELGDPDCVWSSGATPARASGISHPGLCPIGSTTCTNSWEVCPKRFECPALNQPGVYTRNFTVNESTVPPQQTTYMCQAFELNQTAQSVHVIGSRPIIRNKNVMHHAIMYGCSKKPDQKLFDSPQNCFMSNQDCQELLNLWAFGLEGECFNDNAGVLIGDKGYRYALLELHWNNPEKRSTYKDSSGFSLYMTNTLRPNHMGTLMYGEMQLTLPPKQPLIAYNHTCPGACTSHFHNGTRYITGAVIHMHKYGVKGRVTLMRDGKVVKELVPMHDYDYNSPTVHVFNPAIEYKQGDEIKTECYFATKKATQSVFWGFDTDEEMCFSFITYYPNEVEKTVEKKLGSCLAFGGMNQCMFRLSAPHIEAECNVTALRTGTDLTAVITAMTVNRCLNTAGCHPTCRNYLNSTLWPSNACFDPKRSRRMAEVLSMNSYLSIAATNQAKWQISQYTGLVLYGQAACEKELHMLQQTDADTPTSPMNTSQMPSVMASGLSSGHQLAIILVCVCLGFLLAFAALGVLAMKLRGGRSGGAMAEKRQYTFDQTVSTANE